MALDYSEKRLVSQGFHKHPGSKRTKRLQRYAVITGFFSMLISIATLLLMMMK